MVKNSKAQAVVPCGIIKGLIPSATMSVKTLSSGGNNTSDTVDSEAVAARFDTGGLENLDNDEADIVERKYTRYHVSGAKANIGLQV